jgi:ABC-type tungstate transport system substrate-binding protein
MANQKYTGMKILRLLLVTGAVNGDTINYTLTTSQFSNVGQYPIAVTLGLILIYCCFN